MVRLCSLPSPALEGPLDTSSIPQLSPEPEILGCIRGLAAAAHGIYSPATDTRSGHSLLFSPVSPGLSPYASHTFAGEAANCLKEFYVLEKEGTLPSKMPSRKHDGISLRRSTTFRLNSQIQVLNEIHSNHVIENHPSPAPPRKVLNFGGWGAGVGCCWVGLAHIPTALRERPSTQN